MSVQKTAILTSKYCWEYAEIGHPEAPFRVKDTYEYLKEKKEELEVEFVYIDNEIEENILLLTHTKELIEQVKLGNFFDLDTPNLPNIFFYAKISANIVLESLKIALKGKKAFALTRPPGHHATRNKLGGFCYFNNVACAINWYLHNISEPQDKKAAIIDIDVHHGNGTEEIFLGRDDVLFISIHQAGIYPGSGIKSKHNCINFPLAAGVSDIEYLKTLEEAIKIVENFKPKILAVSCGFDTFKDDPLAAMKLTENCYYEISKKISELNIPTFFALEGGYSKKLPFLVEKFLKGLK